MYNRAANVYRQVNVDSSPPTRILDELYGAFLQDCEAAAERIEAGDRAAKGRHISRALAIIGELEAALDRSIAPELTQNLLALYGFARARLFAANTGMNAKPLLEVVRVLGPLREAFSTAAKQAKIIPLR
jgi:flagellar secretion chaperone FliS